MVNIDKASIKRRIDQIIEEALPHRVIGGNGIIDSTNVVSLLDGECPEVVLEDLGYLSDFLASYVPIGSGNSKDLAYRLSRIAGKQQRDFTSGDRIRLDNLEARAFYNPRSDITHIYVALTEKSSTPAAYKKFIQGI
jgi:hypothetical protein